MLFHHGQFTESPYCVVSVQVLYRGLRESKIGSYNNYMNKNMVICYFTLTFYQTMNPVQADTLYTKKKQQTTTSLYLLIKVFILSRSLRSDNSMCLVKPRVPTTTFGYRRFNVSDAACKTLCPNEKHTKPVLLCLKGVQKLTFSQIYYRLYCNLFFIQILILYMFKFFVFFYNIFFKIQTLLDMFYFNFLEFLFFFLFTSMREQHMYFKRRFRGIPYKKILLFKSFVVNNKCSTIRFNPPFLTILANVAHGKI